MSEASQLFDAETVTAIVTHMNEDHADALMLYVSAFTDIVTDSISELVMTDIDSNGMTLGYRLKEQSAELRIDFVETLSRTLSAPAQAREVLVDLVKLARQKTTKE